ncbi:MAG TPA: ABC transporter permease [Chryseosolibacter sp.]
MIRNFFLVALRQILKNKTYSVINIGGLGVGFACCIAIALYTYDELSYDRFHPNTNIYRVTEIQEQAGNFYNVASTPGPLAKELSNDFPVIEETCRIGRFWRAPVLTAAQNSIEPGNVLFAENSLFHMFNFPLMVGNAKSALTGVDDIVLTESTAAALFGANWKTENIIGREVILNNRVLAVVGVAKNPPVNSHLQFDALLSLKHEEVDSNNFGWNSNNYHTYIALKPESDVGLLTSSIFRYLDKFDKEGKTTLHLQHLHDIYLHSDFAFQTDWAKHSSFTYIRIFVAVGVIVLVIAIFNFINLCTARAMNRAKEVGVRKVVGAVRKQLIGQFLVETFLMTALAVLLALFLLQLSLPLLNEISGKQLITPLDDIRFVATLMLCTAILTFMAGLYPAFYLSVFQPAKVLKGYFTSTSGMLFRKTLVVVQFSFSVILIIGTIVIYSQLMFLQEKNLGFDQDNLIDLHLKNDVRKYARLMKGDLLNESSVVNATITTSNMVENTSSTTGSSWEGQTEGDNFLLTHMNVDPDFIAATGMKLIAGRNFDPKIASDSISAYILNETAVKRMGYTPESALGKKITFWDKEGYVIGVVNDFHFQAMTTSIEPMLLRNWPSSWSTSLLVRARAGQVRQAIAAVEKIYKKYEQQTAPSYQFLDQALENQYRLEQNTGKIVLCFSVLAILVSCLGLFGLATHSAEQRTKEVGIRKVLGASVFNIVSLLSADFVKLVLVSIVIASPIGWVAMNQWLNAFAYKISIGWWIFAAAALTVVVIALMTVSTQSIRAAISNPVKALRSE